MFRVCKTFWRGGILRPFSEKRGLDTSSISTLITLITLKNIEKIGGFADQGRTGVVRVIRVAPAGADGSGAAGTDGLGLRGGGGLTWQLQWTVTNARPCSAAISTAVSTATQLNQV